MAGKINFKIGKADFKLVSLFNGKEQILYKDQVVSEAGSLMEQLRDRRVHDFEIGGYKFNIIVTSRMGPKNFKATINDKPVDVIVGETEYTPTQKATSAALVFVVAPLGLMLMSLYPLISKGKMTAMHNGGVAGGILGVAGVLAYTFFAKKQKKRKRELNSRW